MVIQSTGSQLGFPTGVTWRLGLTCRAVVIVQSLSRVLPSVTLWAEAYQAALSMGIPRQEYWSGLHIFFHLPAESDLIAYGL